MTRHRKAVRSITREVGTSQADDAGPRAASANAGNLAGSVHAALAEAAHLARVPVVKEQRRIGIHGSNARHRLVGELEVEDVEVFRHPIRPH